MTMRTVPARLLLAVLAGPVQAQAPIPCERPEGTMRPDITPAIRHEVLVDASGPRRIVLTLPDGHRTTTDLDPVGNGVTVRLIAFPNQQNPDPYRVVFNRAVVEPGGICLPETFLREPGAAVPRTNWYRLRCNAAPPTK